MSRKVPIDQLGNAIRQDLTLYGKNVIDSIKKEANKSVKQLVRDTKATAPVGHRTKHYRDSITSRKLSENARSVVFVWCVKGSDYRLSHLLEHGHALRNGGRTAGTHFIKNAADPILDDYVRKVEEICRNG